MKKLIIFVISIFITLLGFNLAIAENARVTGEFIIDKKEKSFKDATLEARLYSYDPRLADVSADLFDRVVIKNLKHTKGKESRFRFIIGQNKQTTPNRDYYVTASIYKNFAVNDNNRIFYGDYVKGFLAKVLAKSGNRHVVFKGKKDQDYSLNEAIKYPRSYYCHFREYDHVFAKPKVSARLIVNHNKYKINLNAQDSQKLLEIKNRNKNSLAITNELRSKGFPKTPEIDIYFEVKNISKSDISITIGGDRNTSHINGKGPAYLAVVSAKTFTEELRAGQTVHLKPNATHRWQLKMQSGKRNSIFHYWLKPGQYFLEFTRTIGLSVRGELDDKLTIQSPEIYIQVIK